MQSNRSISGQARSAGEEGVNAENYFLSPVDERVLVPQRTLVRQVSDKCPLSD